MVELETLSISPRIFKIKNVLSEEELDALLAQGKHVLEAKLQLDRTSVHEQRLADDWLPEVRRLPVQPWRSGGVA
jgi:hypothetical protein